MKLARILKHLIAPHWLARRAFPKAALKEIEARISASEKHHGGELRFVIEAGLPVIDLWRSESPRTRAVEVFSRLRVWDTEHNSGVLIYLQLIDRRVEIVADRGIATKVAQQEWDAICRGMEAAFRSGAYRRGALEAVDSVGRLLALHDPAPAGKLDELPDRPVIL